MNFKRKHLTAKIWEYTNDFTFPEDEYFADRSNVGIAFSGGGNRSAALTIGFLRALNDLDLLKNVKYISGVSGGAWAAIPFTYLDHSISDNHFLGELVLTEDLTLEKIKTAEKRSFINAISNTILIDDLIKAAFKGDERFAKVLSNLYLKDFLIGNPAKFFTLNTKSLDNIISREVNSKEIGYEDFYFANSNNRPFLITSGVLTRSNLIKINRYPFEMTPLYCGVAPFYSNAGSLGRFDIGGGYTDPFAIDTDSPDDEPNNDLVSVRLKNKRNIFSLADVMAVTGSAPAEYTDRFGWEFIGFPEFKYWSPANPEKAKEYDFVDGGYLDNSGIMPLLRRKVKKIVLFMNTKSSIRDGKFSRTIQTLFEEVENYYGKNDFSLNIVLNIEGATGNSSYNELKNFFLGLSPNDLPIYKQNYKTVHNPHWGIDGEHEVEILWVYNSYCSKWANGITDPDLKEYILDQRERKGFPNYGTFMLNPPKLIDMDVEQANILAHHAAFIVKDAKKEFKSFIKE